MIRVIGAAAVIATIVIFNVQPEWLDSIVRATL